MAADQTKALIDSMPIAYAVTYMFGTVGSAIVIAIFGPALLRWRGRSTTYQVALVPLGGFVQIAGMDPGEGIPDDDSGSYASKGPWARFFTILAGPLTKLPCLGFVKGSNCPHYDSEKERRPTYQAMVRAGLIKDGYAADDGVGLHLDRLALALALHQRAARDQRRHDAIDQVDGNGEAHP